MIGEETLYNPDYMPCFLLSAEQKAGLLGMEERIKKKIIGQDEVVSKICRIIKRNYAGFKEASRPAGSLFFTGVTGVGKTELCKVLAEVLYGDEKKLIKLDMSEFMDKHSMTRLIGAAPGYIGHENGSVFVNDIKANAAGAVLCVDEVEKAHPDIFNLFLQILDDSVLTSSHGEKVYFNNILIIFTSNIGTAEIANSDKPIGFSKGYNSDLSVKEKISAALKKTFKPEFLNRIDEIVMFNKLSEKHIHQICKNMLRSVQSKAQSLNINLEFDKSVVTELAKLGYNEEYGARELRRVISNKIENLLADKILTNELNAGDCIRVIFNENSGFETEKKQSVKAAEGYGESNE